MIEKILHYADQEGVGIIYVIYIILDNYESIKQCMINDRLLRMNMLCRYIDRKRFYDLISSISESLELLFQ